MFEKLISYRSYRFSRTKDTISAFETTVVRMHLKKMELTMAKKKFEGNDHIHVFVFLIRFVNESDMLNMSEVQAFIEFPTFLE